MAHGSFTSPGGAPPKMKTGHSLPKYKQHSQRPGNSTMELDKTSDPLRHASSRIPRFAQRHHNTNNKQGFHTTPAQPHAGRLARKPGKPKRGSGHENRALL